MEKLCHTTSCQLVVDRENKNKENSATKYKKTYISGKIYVPQLVLDLQLVEKGVQLDEFNKHKKKQCNKTQKHTKHKIRGRNYVPQLVVGWQLAEKGVQLAEEPPSDRNINYKLEMKNYDTESKLRTNWQAMKLEKTNKI